MMQPVVETAEDGSFEAMTGTYTFNEDGTFNYALELTERVVADCAHEAALCALARRRGDRVGRVSAGLPEVIAQPRVRIRLRDPIDLQREIQDAVFPGDGFYNMDVDEASECARLVGARHSIPVHIVPVHDMANPQLFDRARAEAFKAKEAEIKRKQEEDASKPKSKKKSESDIVTE